MLWWGVPLSWQDLPWIIYSQTCASLEGDELCGRSQPLLGLFAVQLPIAQQDASAAHVLIRHKFAMETERSLSVDPVDSSRCIDQFK